MVQGGVPDGSSAPAARASIELGAYSRRRSTARPYAATICREQRSRIVGIRARGRSPIDCNFVSRIREFGLGVLVNDLDPDGESLTAVLETPPAHGDLTLNADGSFVYVPAPGFTGVDTFIYRAMDEVEALTAPTIVDITVR
jgi:hypothetical protein